MKKKIEFTIKKSKAKKIEHNLCVLAYWVDDLTIHIEKMSRFSKLDFTIIVKGSRPDVENFEKEVEKIV